MHILHIDTGARWRGGQQQAWWLIESLQKLGIQQTLLVPGESEFAKRALAFTHNAPGCAAICVRHFKTAAGKVLSYENARLVGRAAVTCDLIHAHDAHAHTLAWAAQKMSLRRLPPLIVARRVSFPIRWLGRVKNRQPAWFIAVSEYVRKQLIASGIPPERARVVHDGVRLPQSLSSAEERRKLRRELGINDKDFVLGTLSSLAPEKMLPETLSLITSLPEDCRFLLGIPAAQADSAAANTLLELAHELRMAGRFQIVPIGAGEEDLLWALDCFLYFSKSEGLGSAILLAMAHGLPVIASRTGGIPEIVADQETGVLIDTSAGAWESQARRAILTLRASPGGRNRFGTQGRAFVAQQASSDNMVARTLAIYREILAATAEESRLARS